MVPPSYYDSLQNLFLIDVFGMAGGMLAGAGLPSGARCSETGLRIREKPEQKATQDCGVVPKSR
jgi:hypothetical protein